MESPTRIPQALSPCSSGRSRLSTDSNSPEFEFCRLQDSSFPQPDLLSADELFSGGILLPLSHLSVSHPDPSRPDPEPPSNEPGDPSPEEDKHSEEARVVAEAGAPTVSKRWRDMFKKLEKRPEEGKERSEKKKKEKRGQGGSGSPELNINIWPFSRSRSAGNSGSRPRSAVGAARKVSSAPCSRSNSAGEDKSRKWPSSPGRAGVHLGRSSPVWQVRRTSFGVPKSSDPIPRSKDKSTIGNDDTSNGAPHRSRAAAGVGRRGSRAGAGTSTSTGTGTGTGTAKARVLNLNVPMCMGYRQHLSCKGGDSSAIAVSTGIGGGGPESGGNGSGGAAEAAVGGGSSNLFNLRSLFSRKVY